MQFSHFSVKEFLTSDRLATAIGDISFHHIALKPAHMILAQASLGVLLLLDDSPREISVQRFPLAEYAAEHWVDHVLFEDVSLRLQDGMQNLFSVDKPHFSRWIRIHDLDDISWGLAEGEVLPKRLEAAPVYYAALCGFPDVVEKLISEHLEHVNARGGAFGTALHAAATRNHVDVGQLLLKYGADVNSLGQWEQTPLHIASVWDHLDIGRWLLEHGADVNAKQDDHWTPLHEAANNGHFELVRALLAHHADINAQNEIGNTPLHATAASSNGEVHIARLLLDNGADLEARGKDQSTPLHVASCYGKLEVAHLLPERGADVDAEDDEGRTAYRVALQEGHDEIAQLLLGRGVENKT